MNAAAIAAAFAEASAPGELTMADVRATKGIHPMQQRVPPDAIGIPFDVWRARQNVCEEEDKRRYREQQAAADAKRAAFRAPATKRDRYGWKSLPDGSSLLDAPGRRAS
jgi:hypothetical protein